MSGGGELHPGQRPERDLVAEFRLQPHEGKLRVPPPNEIRYKKSQEAEGIPSSKDDTYLSICLPSWLSWWLSEDF